MMNRSHDTRLLENLVKCEREYCNSLQTLLSLSHSSLSALSAYGAALSPTTSRAVLSVSVALDDADRSFSAYGDSIDDWREKLGMIKKLDAEIEVAVRDREILVTRLIKVSKFKPKGSSSSSSGTKLAVASSELQACEAHLADKQHELESLIRSAILDGLERRCKALADCGSVWTEKAREGLSALEELRDAPLPNGYTSPYPLHPPRPPFRLREGSRSIDSHTSLSPSQSASQIGIQRPSEDTNLTGFSSGFVAPVPPVKEEPRPTRIEQPKPPPQPQSQPPTTLLPAQPIEDRAGPAGVSHRIEEDDEDGDGELDLNSSSESEAGVPLQVHENPVRSSIVFPAEPLPLPQTQSQSSIQLPPQPPAPPPVRTPSPMKTTSMLRRITEEPTQTSPIPGPSTVPLSRPSQPSPSPERIPLHTLKKPPTTGPRRLQPVRRPTDDSSNQGSTHKARSASFSVLGSLTSLFGGKKRTSSVASGSTTATSPTKSRFFRKEKERDASPPPPLPSTRSEGWHTRTDQHLRDGGKDMIVGSRGPAIDDGSSDEDVPGRRRKGSLFLKKKRKLGDAQNQNKNNAGNGLVMMENDMMTRRLTDAEGTLGTGARPRPRTIDLGDDEDMGSRRLSRHSSDGALHSRSNSLSKATGVTPKSKAARDDSELASAAIARQNSILRKSQPAPAFSSSPISPLPKPPPSPTTPPGGGSGAGSKIRKRNSGKHFDDGLGSAGGSLIVGPLPTSSSPRSAGGNEVLAGGGGVSRSNTVRSAASGSTATSTHRRRSSNPVDSNRSTSPEPTRSGIRNRPTQNTNNLMSIVEAGGSQSKLEIVRAPASVTADPELPSLFLPSASTFGPPVPSKSNAQNSGARRSMDDALPHHPHFASEPSRARTISQPANGIVAPKPTRAGEIKTAEVDVSRTSSIRSNGTPSALMPPPLRSALRNRSPSPIPNMQSPPTPPVKSPDRPSLPLPSSSGRLPPVKDDDQSSISSYETGNESFGQGDESDAPTIHGDKDEHPQLIASNLPPPLPEKGKGTDISTSTTETDSTSQPQRRKSVRMALPPSVASTPVVTPAAVEEGMIQNWPQTESRPRSQAFAEKDVWAESDSDEGGEYGAARKALVRATNAFTSAGKLGRE